MSIKSSTALRRLLATLGALTVACAAMTASAGVAAASPAGHTEDAIAFTSHVYLTPPQPGSSTGRFTLVADTCSITPNGRPAARCTFVGSGTVDATGGTATGYVMSRYGVIVLDETYAFTSATTSVGSGPATEYRLGAGLRTGSFTGSFTTATTSDPNVLLDWGTLTVTH